MSNHIRVVPLDGRPHLPQTVHLWQGDGRGHWEGDTLVVETTNFTKDSPVWDNTGIDGGGDEHLRIIERFSLLKPGVLLYQYTVDDPTSWVRPWTAQLTMTKIQAPIFEYSCNEGDHSLENILSAARARDAEIAGKKGAK
jgi:hypothetical protein